MEQLKAELRGGALVSSENVVYDSVLENSLESFDRWERLQ